MFHPARIVIALLSLAFSLVCHPSHAAAPSPDDGFKPAIGAWIDLAAQPDGKVIVDFQRRIYPDGSRDLSYRLAATSGTINRCKVQPDGRILMIGGFTLVGGAERNGVVRLNSDGSLDPSFNPATPHGSVFKAIVLQKDGKVLLGGKNIIRLNQDGSIDTTFATIPETLGIGALAISSRGKILVAGSFDSIGGIPRVCLARLHADGSVDESFDARLASGSIIESIARAPDDKLWINGNYKLPGETSTRHIARLKEDGSIDITDYYSFANSYSEILVQPDGKVLICGSGKDGDVQVKRVNADGSIDPGFVCDSYYISAVLLPDGKIMTARIVVEGTAYTPTLSLFNPDGTADETFNAGIETDYTIDCMTMQRDGKLVIGGYFSDINGGPHTGIARLNSDGSVDDAFNARAHPVYCIAEQLDGKLVIGGSFTQVNGVDRKYIARLNADGSLDEGFTPTFYSPVTKVAIQTDGKILIDGSSIVRVNPDGCLDTNFSNIRPSYFLLQDNGKIVFSGASIVRINTDDSIDETFTPAVQGFVIAVQSDGKLIAVNTLIGGLVRLNGDGTLDASFTPDPKSIFTFYRDIIIQPDGKLIITGQNGFRAPFGMMMARLNPDGSLDTSFDIGEDGLLCADTNDVDIRSVVLREDGRILLAGVINEFDGVKCANMLCLTSNGIVERDDPFCSTGTDDAVRSIACQFDDRILIGGRFARLNGAACGGIARLTSDRGWMDSSYDPGSGADGDVNAIAALADGKAMIGGAFTSYSGKSANRLARINADGSLDTSFSLFTGANGDINAIAVQPNGKFLIGGGFTSVNGRACGRIARLNYYGSYDGRLNAGAGANDDINCLALQPDGRILIGGKFTSVDGTARGRIARLGGDGKLDASFAALGANGPINSIVVQEDGRILVAGEFTNFNGLGMNRIARLNPDGSLDGMFSPGAGADGAIMSMALQADGRIRIVGEFTTFDGVSRGRLARLNADGSLDASYDPGSGAEAAVLAIANQRDGRSIIGGDFQHIKGYARRHFARLTTPDCVQESIRVSDDGNVITWSLGGSAPVPYQVLFEHSGDGVNYYGLGWGSPVKNIGFCLTHPNIPIMPNQYVRATGWVAGGQYNGSVSLIRSTYYHYDETPHVNAAADWMWLE